MTKRILSVGNCGPDHVALQRLLRQHFVVELQSADGLQDALAACRATTFDLVLVNRLMDRDGSEGLEIIRAIKSEDALREVPVLMITNYPEHQQAAVAVGAVRGFGKANLHAPETLSCLREALGDT